MRFELKESSYTLPGMKNKKDHHLDLAKQKGNSLLLEKSCSVLYISAGNWNGL